jgi:hypothetical protein
MKQPFKINIIGKINRRENVNQLTILADYKASRVLSHISLEREKMNDLIQGVQNLRGFVEGRSPIFATSQLKDLGTRMLDVLLSGTVRDLFFQATGDRRAESSDFCL